MYTPIQGSIKPIIHITSVVSLDMYEKKKFLSRKMKTKKMRTYKLLK